MAGPRKAWRRVRTLLRFRREAGSVLVHDRVLKHRFPADLALRVLCGPARGRHPMPADLTIVVSHDYGEESLMERSVRYVTGSPCALAPIPRSDRWRFTEKVTALQRFLQTAKATEFVLFADANDCVLRDDPRRAVSLLLASDARLLFSGTHSAHLYRHMPEVEAWARSVAPADAPGGRFLNSGVFVGDWFFVRAFVDAAAEYVVSQDAPDAPRPTVRNEKNGTIQATDRFPYGIENDQTLYRYLQPRFHPEVKVDYRGLLAARGLDERT
jgi:hypothetical protein